MQPSFRDGPIALNSSRTNPQMGGDLVFRHPPEEAQLHYLSLPRCKRRQPDKCLVEVTQRMTSAIERYLVGWILVAILRGEHRLEHDLPQNSCQLFVIVLQSLLVRNQLGIRCGGYAPADISQCRSVAIFPASLQVRLA